jgi:hypothetical protein
MAKIFVFFSNDVILPNENGEGTAVKSIGILYDAETKKLKTSNKIITEMVSAKGVSDETHEYIMDSMDKNKIPELFG